MIAMTTMSSIRVKPCGRCLISGASRTARRGLRNGENLVGPPLARSASGVAVQVESEPVRAAVGDVNAQIGSRIVDLGETFDHRPPRAFGLALAGRGLHAGAGVDPHPVRARGRPLVACDRE